MSTAGSGSQIENQKSKIVNPIGWFDVEALPIMQEALRKRLQAARVAFDMGTPYNELTKIFDLGFKPQPWGNDGFLPTKYQRLTKSSSSSGPSSSSS
jgi:hypothetical protein